VPEASAPKHCYGQCLIDHPSGPATKIVIDSHNGAPAVLETAGSDIGAAPARTPDFRSHVAADGYKATFETKLAKIERAKPAGK
jgi:hypothetical protein